MNIGAESLDKTVTSRARRGHPRSRLALPNLRMRISERRALLFLIDALLINGSLVIAVWLGLDIPPTISLLPNFLKWYIVLTTLWVLCALFFDCYNLARAASTFNGVRSGMLAALSTALIYPFIPVVTPPLGTRSYIFFFIGLAVSTVAVWRATYAQLFVQPWFKQRALIVGVGWAGRTLARAMQTASPHSGNPYRGTGYELVGFIDDQKAYHGALVEGLPVLGDHSKLPHIAKEQDVDEIIIAITHRHAINPAMFNALLQCQEQGFRLLTMPVLYERLLGRVPVEHIGRDLQMIVSMEDNASERLYRMSKRGMDIVLALAGLMALGLLTPVVALANAITCPGPIFYRQQRVGQGGRLYTMIKFRSMVPDAESGIGAVWACADDRRISWIGHFLRKTRLDELPQVINVLRGEMSVIGPRPERPEFVEQLAHELPFYRARHVLRPGITGWAQVQFNYGNSVDDARVKLEYDLYYIKHASLLLDIRILLQTVSVMILMKGL